MEFDASLPAVKKPRKKAVKKFSTKNLPIEVAVRRQVASEIGEDEPTKDQKFILFQKFGVAAPRIDRLITKPNWMEVSTWKRKVNEYFQATKGLVNPSQRSRFRPNNSLQQPGFYPKSNKPSLSQNGPLNPRFQRNNSPKWNPSNQQAHRPDTRTFPRNYGPTRTETLPS